uniref:ATPase AAA-type core domain-containing protein n=1 Tax=Plectus sambesii TaxID=2011161 RepID=A0A914WLM0_9BILA
MFASCGDVEGIEMTTSSSAFVRTARGFSDFFAELMGLAIHVECFEDSSSLSSGLSENIDDISTDDLTGSSLSDHQMAAAAFGKYGDYCGGRLSKHQLLAQQQQRHRSSSQQSSSLLQRKLTEQENIDQLLQKCRSSQRGLGTFGDRPRSEATMSHDPAGAPRRSVAVGAKHPQHYNTIGGGGLRAPKLQLSEDGETLHVSRQDGFRSARAPLRNIIRTVEDERDDGGHGHQRPGSAQSHGLTTSPPGISGYHSLDRKRHLINYYNDADYRTANATDRAATMALVSPRRMPNGSLSLPVSHEGPLPPEETAWNRHSVTTASRSPSISSAINGRLAHQTGVMSRSMIVESQELKASPTNGSADISTVANGRSSPHVQNQRLAAAQGFRQNGVQNGHGSPRKTSEGIYANIHREGQQLQLHKLTGADGGRSPAHSAPVYHHNSSRVADPSPYLSSVLSKVNAKQHGEAEVNGSSLSLASTSSSIYSTAEEKYQAEIRKLHREMEAYREKVTTLTAQQTTYANMIQAFDKALQGMIRRVEGLQMVSQQKEDEVGHLRGEIDVLRQLSINAGINVDQAMVLRGASPAVQRRHTFSDQQQQQLQQLQQQQQQQQLNNGGTGLVRQPSIESVASQRSSVSTSSKGSKTDKLSLNSFGRQGKKSWIRSSFTRAFSKNRKSKNGSISDAEDMKDGHSPMHSGRSEVGRLKSISGSASGLDEVGIESLTKLKEELEKKDSTLTDVRLEALLKSDQVDELQEAINRLRSENASLKHDNHRLHQIVLSGSRAGSQTSLPLLNDGDGDSMSDAHGPTSASDRGYCISSHDESGARVKVLVSLDMTGELTMDAACDDSELFIGSISAPTWSTTWDALDNDLSKIFTEYLHRIDPTGSLKLNGRESIIGYQLGRAVRDKRTAAPKSSPAESLQSCASQSATLRLMLQGVAQRSVDALVLDSLIPRNLLERLLSQLTDSRRVILSGACATGKSFLAQKLAEYLMLRTGAGAAKSSIETLCLPEDAQGKEKEAQNRLTAIVQRHKQGNGPAVIVIDNLHNVTVLSDFFGCLTNVAGSDGPYIIGTMNQSSTQMQTTLQVHLNFRMTLFANHMDSVKGYLGRFLRRRLIHEECKMGTRHAAEFVRVVEFLPKVWALLNNFIETANSADVSIGPRLFMSCPISVHESREWFIQLWNCKIIPYLVEAAHEGLTLFGRRGSLEDPTDFVCDEWPWAEGEAADAVLRRLSAKDVSLTSGDLPFAKSKFDPLEALLRLQSNRNGHEINLSSS